MPGMRRYWTASSVVTLVLVGSVVVTTMLAWQAMKAGEQRQAVIDAMLRDYARLAAYEFIREAGKDIEMSVMRTAALRAHSDRPVNESECGCEPLASVEEWFEYLPSTGAFSDSQRITPSMKEQIAREAGTTYRGIPERGARLWHLPNDPDGRIVALKWEPHLGSAGGYMGLMFRPQALEPILRRTYRRAILLPGLSSYTPGTDHFVDLKVLDRSGRAIFASTDTAAGPHGFQTNLLPGSQLIDLRIDTSMTPSFVAGLGPEQGVGPGRRLVMGLVVVNILLVAIGIWQLVRERELARLRANFVTGVSHELRTPLAQIRMFAETLMLDRVRSPEESRRAADIIGRESRRLGQLVENVLYFHKHDRLPTLDAKAIIDLVPLVDDVVKGFALLAASRRIELTFASGAPELLVHGSADGLRQVVLNLLDNAVKFGPPEQTVSVTLDTAGERARLTVEDQGPGIAESERRRIFNAFERGRETRGTGGAGIGLAVVKQIVHAHRGSVSVNPAPSGGARFVVTLPANPNGE